MTGNATEPTDARLDLTRALALVSRISEKRRNLVLDVAHQKIKPDLTFRGWFASQCLAATGRGDYELILALAHLVNLPNDAERIRKFVEWRADQAVEIAREWMQLLGSDFDVRHIPRPVGAPKGFWRLAGGLFADRGFSLRATVIALWWVFAPYTPEELNTGAQMDWGTQTPDGNRRWIQCKARSLLNSVRNARERDRGLRRKGLQGFIRLAGKPLAEWPARSLETVNETII